MDIEDLAGSDRRPAKSKHHISRQREPTQSKAPVKCGGLLGIADDACLDVEAERDAALLRAVGLSSSRQSAFSDVHKGTRLSTALDPSFFLPETKVADTPVATLLELRVRP